MTSRVPIHPGNSLWFRRMGIDEEIYRQIVRSSDCQNRLRLLEAKHTQELQKAIRPLKYFYRKRKKASSPTSYRYSLGTYQLCAVALEVALEKGIITNSQADEGLEKIRALMDEKIVSLINNNEKIF